MAKDMLIKSRRRVEKVISKAVKDRKIAAERGDTVTELSLSDKIEDYNTIICLIDSALEDHKFNNHIMNRFTRIN